MKQPHTKQLVMTALFAALATTCTITLVVPMPTGGYVNLGDCIVLLGAYFLGPWYGAIAGGFGSALADILLGYTLYAPATLLIKGLMAVVAGSLMHLVGTRLPGRITCGLMAEVVMIVGYWLYDAMLCGSLVAAAVSLGSNSIQGLFGVIASTALVMSLNHVGSVRQNFPLLRG